MILLIVFAFLAGIVTILSPCILPILPIILSSGIAGQENGKSRPLGVVFGFVLSFTFFTLFLSTIVKLSGISADALRIFSVIVIAGFGVSLLISQFQLRIEKLFSKLAGLVPQESTKENQSIGRQGFGKGLLIGSSLGLLWTPCVGPILASVISLAITETVTLDAFIITFAYSLGTAIPLFLIMLSGQNALKRIPWLVRNTTRIQKAFGILMILTAIGILTNTDRRFQTFILDTFPQYGAGLTKFEDIPPIRKQLENITGKKIQEKDLGKPMFDTTKPNREKAPEIIPGGVWFNSNPLTLEKLKGKVVLIDFWTYSCINCQRTLPYLKKWWETYKDKGLVIIGVHSPEFEFEKQEKNVLQAITDFGITYPVVQDNDFATWNAYDNLYWPAKYFIDKEGYIRYSHFGEGAYDESERIIQTLLKEMGVKDISEEIRNPVYQIYSKTPETYLGYERIHNFGSNEQIVQNMNYTYTTPKTLSNNKVAFEGNWKVAKEYALPQKGTKLYLNFESKEVFLVMRTKGKASKVKVYVDDKMQYFGEDAANGMVSVDSDRLYKLINLPSPGRHILKLEFDDNFIEVYAFTFG